MTGVENAMDQENVDWSPEETEMAKQSLRQNGNNWAKMAEKITSKTEEQCKQFFYSQRKKLQLDKIVQEFKKVSVSHILNTQPYPRGHVRECSG